MAADPDFPQLPSGAFAKEDFDADAVFYAEPRMETHIDDAAIAALTNFYREILPPGGVLLDLMSSWISHLPDDVAYGEVIGHGMNGEELAANRRFSRWFTQDFNQNAALNFPDASIDAAMICVGVQYLQQPLPVFREIARILRPGAPLVISFSNRCFPTKAVAIWLALDTRGHAELVELYLRRAGFNDVAAHLLVDGRRSDPLVAVVGRV